MISNINYMKRKQFFSSNIFTKMHVLVPSNCERGKIIHGGNAFFATDKDTTKTIHTSPAIGGPILTARQNFNAFPFVER